MSKLLRHNSRKGRNIVTTSNKPINIFNMGLSFFELAIGVLSIASVIPVVVAILLLRE